MKIYVNELQHLSKQLLCPSVEVKWNECQISKGNLCILRDEVQTNIAQVIRTVEHLKKMVVKENASRPHQKCQGEV